MKKPKKSPYELLANALKLKLGDNWHFTGHTAFFLTGYKNQPPQIIEVANTKYSGSMGNIRFYKISNLAKQCGIVLPYRTASPSRVNADMAYLYLKGQLPLSAVPGMEFPPCVSLIHPKLPQLAEIFNPTPIPFEILHTKSNSQAEYVDAILSLAVKPFQQVAPPLRHTSLVLKGGTAIVKAYLGHYRFSYDLDFSLKSIITGRCLDTYQEEFIWIARKLGFRIQEINHSLSGRIATLLLEFPHGERPIKLTVSCLDGELCKRARKRPLKSVIGVEGEGYVMNLQELLAEKLRALATRRPLQEGKNVLYRDLVDIFYLKQHTSVDKECLRKKMQAIKDRSAYQQSLKEFLANAPEALLPPVEPILNPHWKGPIPTPEELLETLRWSQNILADSLNI